MKRKHADATAAEGPGPVASTLDTCDDPAYEKVWTFGPSPQLIIVKKTFENEETTKNVEDKNKMKPLPQQMTLPVTEEHEDATAEAAAAEVIEGPASPVASTSNTCDPSFETILPFDPYPEQGILKKPFENEDPTNEVKQPMPQPPPLRLFGLPLSGPWRPYTLPVREEVKKDKWDSSFFLHMNRYNLEEAESCSSRNVEEAQVSKEPPKTSKIKSRKEGGKLVGVSKVKRRQSNRLLVKATLVGGRRTDYKE